MATGRIDVHGHLLPRVDDGCATVDDSLACGRMLRAAGYTHAFCTPHVWPHLPHNTVAEIALRVRELQSAFDEADIGITLLPGGEINLLSSWPKLRMLPRGEIATYALANKYVLFDFWADDWRDCAPAIEAGIDYLQSLGLTLICAHPERIKALQQPQALLGLTDRGVLLQLNAWCLMEPADSILYQTAVRWLTEGRYFVIGTDTHNARTLTTRLDGLCRATELVGKAQTDLLTMENPRKLLE